MTTAPSEKKTAEYAPHFKDSKGHTSLKKAAMDLDEYKPSKEDYVLPHPVWLVSPNVTKTRNEGNEPVTSGASKEQACPKPVARG